MSRACAAGRLRKCHCAEANNVDETRETWKWGGCGDNLAYGRAFALKFLDAGSSAGAGGGNPKSKSKSKNNYYNNNSNNINSYTARVSSYLSSLLQHETKMVIHQGGVIAIGIGTFQFVIICYLFLQREKQFKKQIKLIN